jgi:hypothetical protein
VSGRGSLKTVGVDLVDAKWTRSQCPVAFRIPRLTRALSWLMSAACGSCPMPSEPSCMAWAPDEVGSGPDVAVTAIAAHLADKLRPSAHSLEAA